jgi:glyoxylase-like metal-dependent hydrolase (beta-lactamase superfamily II)
MNTLAAGISWVDLLFLGRRHAIATVVIRSAGTLALIDPGPSTCLETLELGLQSQGLRLSDVTDLLLTHIHLDHAGATGTIVRRHPNIRVLVHERGAPHMADPAKLLASATRLYGDRMDELWGEFAAVPGKNMMVVSGGERIEAGGRAFEIAYTPGHASHHVSYFDRSSGVAFVGDVAGIRRGSGTYILPPTPPPDIDLEAWNRTMDEIERRGPERLALIHFGVVEDPSEHVPRLRAELDRWAELVRGGMSEQEFVEQARTELGEQADLYERAGPLWQSWHGLRRYWDKKAEAA